MGKTEAWKGFWSNAWNKWKAGWSAFATSAGGSGISGAMGAVKERVETAGKICFLASEMIGQVGNLIGGSGIGGKRLSAGDDENEGENADSGEVRKDDVSGR